MIESKPLIGRKKQIIEEAVALFKKNGYSASSVRDLAKQINIEAASLYSHIKSKEELLQIICFDMANKFFEELESVEDKKLSPQAKLRAAIVSHVKVITNNHDEVVVFLNEWKHLSEPYRSELLQMRTQYESKIKNILTTGIKNGDFNIEDVDFAVLTILSAINWISTWYKPEGKMSPQQIADKLADILIKGISS